MEAPPAVVAVLTQSHSAMRGPLDLHVLLAPLACLSARGVALYRAGMVIWAAGKVATSHAADARDLSRREAVHLVHLLATATWASSVMVSALSLTSLTRLAVASPRDLRYRSQVCYQGLKLAM